MYMDKVNAGPICCALGLVMQYCESPAVRNVLACNNLEGDTVGGRVVERLTPDVVMARLIKGTASSMRARRFFISVMIIFSSMSLWARDFARELPLLESCSSATAFSTRLPSDWMSQRRDFVSVTADSSVVFPRAEISSIMSMAGEMIYKVSESVKFTVGQERDGSL
jgi:hypothetical protein